MVLNESRARDSGWVCVWAGEGDNSTTAAPNSSRSPPRARRETETAGGMNAATETPVQLDDTAQIAEPQESLVGQTLPIFGNVVLPRDVDVLNGILASMGLQSEDPEVAISVFFLVFVLVIAVCRSRRCQAVSRLLFCRAAANRGSHQAVSTREEAEHSDGSDEESAPRRQRQTKGRGARPQPKVANGTRRACDTELDHSELATRSIKRQACNANTSRGIESAAAHALADSLQDTLGQQNFDEVEAEVEEATDSEAEAEVVDEYAVVDHDEAVAEAMDSEAIADRAMKHAQKQAVHTRAKEQNAAEEKRAMKERIARLELALASKQAASDALSRQRADYEDESFNFAVQAPAEPGPSNDDDDMTMVMLAQGPASASRELLSASDTHDKRQSRLESVLRRKKEAKAQKSDADAEEAKREARQALRKELLFIDNELDSMTNARTEGPASEDAGSSARHVIASKWLLEYSYSKYPPQAFSTRRAKEELRLVRELRFREAVLKGLKLLQSRYAPEKNTVAQHGAEWAVMAEEIAKHAFALQTGISHFAKQGAISHGDALSDQLHTGETGDVEFGEVDDAD